MGPPIFKYLKKIQPRDLKIEGLNSNHPPYVDHTTPTHRSQNYKVNIKNGSEGFFTCISFKKKILRNFSTNQRFSNKAVIF